MSEFVQVGATALRDPKTGEMLPSVPLYIKKADANRMPAMTDDSFARCMAEKFKTYMEAVKAAGIEM